MGYESRIKITTAPDMGLADGTWVQDLCTMNLACMGSGFKNIFTEDVTFNVYFMQPEDMIVKENKVYDYNPTTEDKYGEKLKYTDINTVINYLRKDGIEYRRSDVLLQTLRAYKECFGNNLIVVHFGY